MVKAFICFLVLFCFQRVEKGEGEVADVWLLIFGLVLLCSVWRAKILLLLIESGDPSQGEWIWDRY